MKIAVIGKTGQLARALAAAIESSDDIEAVFYGRDALDLTSDAKTISAFIESLSVEAVIIAAAYTAVDKAETDQDAAFAVNAAAPAIIAKACAAKNIALLHVSTDYVFNGTAKHPYAVDAPIEPLGVYGRSKADGEAAVLAAHPKAAIVRTSWVFDGSGANFFNTMLRVGAARESLTVVSDQLGRPTYAGHLARTMMDMLPALIGGTASGLYHVTGTGDVISWADFARAIFDINAGHRDHKVTVTDIPSSEYPTPAARPAYSALDTSKYESQFGALPDWQSGLKEAYKEWVLANA